MKPALAALAAIVAVVAGGITFFLLQPSSEFEGSVVYRWSTPDVCVENFVEEMDAATRWAATELDATELDVTYRKSGGCEGEDNRVVMVADQTIDRATTYSCGNLPTQSTCDELRATSETMALESPIEVGFNPTVAGEVEVDRMVALHELMHAVVWLRGPAWGDDGHTSRCDSVLAQHIPCRLDLDGLTAYDRRIISAAYAH